MDSEGVEAVVGGEVAEPVEVLLVAVEDHTEVVEEAFSVRVQAEAHGGQEPQLVTIPTAVEFTTITVQVVAI